MRSAWRVGGVRGLAASARTTVASGRHSRRTTPDEYVKTLTALMEWEREAEISASRQRLSQSYGRLKAEGSALGGLVARREQSSFFGDEVLRFMPSERGTSLPPHRLMAGDVVIISDGEPLGAGAGEGVVLKRTPDAISVVVRRFPKAGFSSRRAEAREGAVGDGMGERRWRLDRGVNEVAFERMAAAIAAVSGKGRGGGAASASASASAVATSAYAGIGRADVLDAKPGAVALPLWLPPVLLHHSLLSTGVLTAVPEPPATYQPALLRQQQQQQQQAQGIAAGLFDDEWDALPEDEAPLFLHRLHAARSAAAIDTARERRIYSFRRPHLPHAPPPLIHGRVGAKYLDKRVNHNDSNSDSERISTADPAALEEAVLGRAREGPTSAHRVIVAGEASSSSENSLTGSAISHATVEEEAADSIHAGLAVAKLQRQWIETHCGGASASGSSAAGRSRQSAAEAAVAALQAAADAEFHGRRSGSSASGGGGASARAGSSSSGRVPPSPYVTVEQINTVLASLHHLNASQRAAIVVGLASRLSLIQGPPGTGKTSTAVHLIRAWRDVQRMRYGIAGQGQQQQSVAQQQSASKQQGEPLSAAAAATASYIESGRASTTVGTSGGASSGKQQASGGNIPLGGQVLAVGSSNTAVDQLLQGIVKQGLKVIRVGDVVRIRSELRACSLDAAVDAHPDMAPVKVLQVEADDIMSSIQRIVAASTKGQLTWAAQQKLQTAAGGAGTAAGQAAAKIALRASVPVVQTPTVGSAAAGQKAHYYTAGYVGERGGSGGGRGGGGGGFGQPSLSNSSGLNFLHLSGPDLAALLRTMITQHRGGRSSGSSSGASGASGTSISGVGALRRAAGALQRKIEDAKRAVARKTVEEAEVICATCTGAGHELLDGLPFTFLVCDEASQIHEAETLIPLSRLTREPHASAVIIGDEQQLPPTVASDRAIPLRVSLFERLVAGAWPRDRDRDSSSSSGSGSKGKGEGKGGVTATARLPASAADLPCLPIPRTLLRQQYRMAPAIAAWPNYAFYSSKLRNARHLYASAAHAPPPGLPWPYCLPIMFVPVSDHAERTSDGHSKYNAAEAEVVVKLVRALLNWRPGREQLSPDSHEEEEEEEDKEEKADEGQKYKPGQLGKVVHAGHIGVVTPYLAQVRQLSDGLRKAGIAVVEGSANARDDADREAVMRSMRRERSGRSEGGAGQAGDEDGNGEDTDSGDETGEDDSDSDSDSEEEEGGSKGSRPDSGGTRTRTRTVEVRSVDGFQGNEKGVIIFSAVRSNPRKEVGFLADYRRLNVALTRAKRGLVVVGDPSTLSADPAWASFLAFLEKNDLMVPADRIPSR